MPDKENFSRSMYFWLFVPYLIPILGGLIVNYVFKDKNENFGYFCLTSSIVHPLLISFLSGYLIGLFFPVNYSTAILIAYLIGIIISYVITARLLNENDYRFFYLIYWFSLIGAIAAYILEDDKNIKEKFGWFVIPFFLVNIPVISLISAIPGNGNESPTSLNVRTVNPDYNFNYSTPEFTQVNTSNYTTGIETLDMQLIENNTVTVEANSYYVQPINLEANQTAQITINVTDSGVVNSVMLNSTEYEKLTGVEGEEYFHYFINSYNSGVKDSNFYVKVPKEDTYYLILSTFPILEGQATYEDPVEVLLSIYTSSS